MIKSNSLFRWNPWAVHFCLVLIVMIHLAGAVSPSNAAPSASSGAVGFVSSRISVSEVDSVAVIEVRRSGGSVGELSGRVVTRSISAQEGRDFTGLDQAFVFTDGEAGVKTFLTPLTAASENYEGSRTFAVDLLPSTPSAWPPSRAIVVISDEQEGRVDPVFGYVSTEAKGGIADFTFQSDGKILVAGIFTNLNDVFAPNIARLTYDGKIDSAFSPGTGPNNFVSSIGIDTNNSIIIAGNFSAYDGAPVKRVAKLNLDGTLDATFDWRSMITASQSWRANVYPDGRFLAYALGSSGRFFTDGAPDNTFMGPIRGMNSTVILPNGDILAQNGASIAKMNANGARLWIIISKSYAPFSSVSPTTEGRTLASTIQLLNQVESPGTGILRISIDGKLDTNFNPSVISPLIVTNVIGLNNGDALIAGRFTNVGGVSRPYLARLDEEGILRPEFEYQFEGIPRTMKLDPAGKIYLVVVQTNANNQPFSSLLRLNSAHSLPPTLTIDLPAAQFNEGDSIPIKVDAVDPDSALVTTELFLDGELLASADSGLLTHVLAGLPAGNHLYRLTGRATDDSNLVTDSQPLEFTISAGGTVAPKIIGTNFNPEGQLIVQFAPGNFPNLKLQSSTDLSSWNDVEAAAVQNNAFVIPADQQGYQFFRLSMIPYNHRLGLAGHSHVANRLCLPPLL
ncbi:MAG: Calx-beta domain-containing protein [Verrucomicrobiales bacterium]